MGKCNNSCYLARFIGHPMHMMSIWGFVKSEFHNPKENRTTYSVNLEALRAVIDWGYPDVVAEYAPAEILEAMGVIAHRMNNPATGGE